MTQDNDLYEILQVSPAAEPQNITAAYRRLARQYHPKINQGPSTAEKFRQITAAYEILGDPSKRREYDRLRKQKYVDRGLFPTSRTKAKQVFWDRHASFLAGIMMEWKNKHFGGMAAIYHNEPLIMVPPIDSPEMTIPNITCRGTGEHIGIWCEETADRFVVGFFSLSASYVACREGVPATGLEQALKDCSRELRAIRSGKPRGGAVAYGREEVVQELLRGNEYRHSPLAGGGFYTEETLDALLYLAATGNTEEATLASLSEWVKDGALRSRPRAGTYSQSKIEAVHYKEVSTAFAHLAETNPRALEYLTNELIEGWREGIPHVEQQGLIDTFLAIDPRRALPETKQAVRKILRSGLPSSDREDFRKFEKRLPGSGIFGRWG